jgi:hypothetical protein
MAFVLHLGGEERERGREIEEDEEDNGDEGTVARRRWSKGSECKGGCECGDESGMILCIAVCVKVVLWFSLAKALDMSGVKAAELWIGGGTPTRGLPALTGKLS